MPYTWPDEQNWPPSWPRVSPRKWWRNYEEECFEWWREFCRHPSTTPNAMIMVLRVLFGGNR